MLIKAVGSGTTTIASCKAVSLQPEPTALSLVPDLFLPLLTATYFIRLLYMNNHLVTNFRLCHSDIIEAFGRSVLS